ncbi:dipeptide ABC transporter ATP-binding protein [bacterium]|nr:dipeptide ABC transporter ATP-binding protein [bacterium]MCI0602656.1 dipeptide ABC transporter ATP-binding protein [bacterium]
MNLLEIRNLVKHYSLKRGLFSRVSGILKAVDGVSFEVKQGETFGLVGESGCGKTTLARCVVRLIEPTSGEIFFDGQNIIKLPQEEMRRTRRRLQMIFQDPYGSLNPRMSVKRIIEEPLVIHKIGTKPGRLEQVVELMKMVGLDPEYRKRYPHEFSGGQRQRIGIARALALHPELIVADEPVSALDVSVQAQIINLLKELQEKLRLTFLFIAHDLSVVQHFSDRIAVMYLGKIVELASSTAVFQQPYHPYTRMLLNSVPVPDPNARRKKEILKGEVPSPVDVPAGCRFHPRCPVAVEQCKSEEPQLRQITPDHWAACHLAEAPK